MFKGDGHVLEVGSQTDLALLEMVSFCICVPAVDKSFLFFLSNSRLETRMLWYFAGGLVSPLHVGKVAHLAEFGAPRHILWNVLCRLFLPVMQQAGPLPCPSALGACPSVFKVVSEMCWLLKV